jgi:preprotein translocase subunit SecG
LTFSEAVVMQVLAVLIAVVVVAVLVVVVLVVVARATSYAEGAVYNSRFGNEVPAAKSHSNNIIIS